MVYSSIGNVTEARKSSGSGEENLDENVRKCLILLLVLVKASHVVLALMSSHMQPRRNSHNTESIMLTCITYLA